MTKRLHYVLQKIQDEGVTLNEKFEFAKEHIIFIAHKISAKALSQIKKKTSKQSYRCQS